jgi:8-oxo-dGTP diphosphatase
MNSIGIGVKAFIRDGDKILLLKRRKNDPHNADGWDIPGGRIKLEEDLQSALQREVLEETGLNTEVLFPFEVHTFTREDGQFIIMVTFLCKLMGSAEIKLSEEHQAYKWVSSDEVANLSHWLKPIVENFRKLGT